MKKNRKILVGATLLASAAVLAGCKDRFQTLYGPPPEPNIEEPAVEPEEQFDPSENEVPALYGPPPVEESTTLPDDSDFNPEENIEEPLYGPPPEEQPQETIQPPGEEQVVHPTLYGPPPVDPSEESTSEESTEIPEIQTEFYEEHIQHQLMYGPPPSIDPPEEVIPENTLETEEPNEN